MKNHLLLPEFCTMIDATLPAIEIAGSNVQAVSRRLVTEGVAVAL